MGKVTFYYTEHTGTGLFSNPEFKKAFREADVVDLESSKGVPLRVIRDANALAAGDKEAYGRIIEAISKLPTPKGVGFP